MAFIDTDDVKAELGQTASDTTDVTLYGDLINSILSLLDRKTGRTWAVGDRTEYYDGGVNKIILRNRPVNSVASIYEDPDWNYSAGDLVPSDDYKLDTKNGIIVFAYKLVNGALAIKVTYNAGYSDDNIPNSIKQILVRQVCHWYKQGKDNQRWDISSLSYPEGGTTSFSQLEKNLLPEFAQLIEEERNILGNL